MGKRRRPAKKPDLSAALTPLAQSLDGPTAGLLRAALGAAVPLWIEKVRLYYDEYREERAHACAQVIAEHGDDILYRSPKKGGTAMAFNHLSEGLALGAFCPGGIKFLGQRWEAETREDTSGLLRGKCGCCGAIVDVEDEGDPCPNCGTS